MIEFAHGYVELARRRRRRPPGNTGGPAPDAPRKSNTPRGAICMPASMNGPGSKAASVEGPRDAAGTPGRLRTITPDAPAAGAARRARASAVLHVGHEELGYDLARRDQFPSAEEPDADEPSHDPVAEGEYTGFLIHDGGVYGLSHKELGDLADLADHPIAEAVRGCTTDQSLPEPDRIVQAANKLTRGPDTGRLVDLARLASPAAIHQAHADWRLDHSRRVRIWREHAWHLARVYARNLTPPARERASLLDRALKALDESACPEMAEVDARVRRGMGRKRELARQRAEQGQSQLSAAVAAG